MKNGFVSTLTYAAGATFRVAVRVAVAIDPSLFLARRGIVPLNCARETTPPNAPGQVTFGVEPSTRRTLRGLTSSGARARERRARGRGYRPTATSRSRSRVRP